MLSASLDPEYLADGRQMIRAGLEDHFMAKLLGLPMGVDACYTNHMDADQNDLENLTVLLNRRWSQLLYGRAHGRRRNALLSEHKLPRHRSSARDSSPACRLQSLKSG
jgi:hypothetical protein